MITVPKIVVVQLIFPLSDIHTKFFAVVEEQEL